MSLDKSRLLGIDALLELGRSVRNDAERFLTDYGPELLLSLLLVAVYAVVFWGLTRLLLWLLGLALIHIAEPTRPY